MAFYQPLIAPLLPAPAASRRAAPVPADTSAAGLAGVWADLRRRSYYLEPAADAPTAWVAANAAQRLTAHLAPALYALTPATPFPARARAGKAPARPAWTVNLTLRGIGRGGQLALRPVAAPGVAARTDTSVRYQHGAAFAVEYTNTPAGVRQNYYLSQRPGGCAGPVQVQLTMATDLQAAVQADGQALALTRPGGGAPVLRYGSLKAWDATGRVLPGRLRLAGATALALEVDDAGAAYPLTIDPLASTPLNRLNDPNNADNDNFGYSVAGAGDVNGDGYGDVVVGAVNTTNGGSQRGSAYLYYGAAAGLGTSVGTTAGTVQRLNDPNNTNNDLFGFSVAGAGDVNGDGYADALVGASGTGNGGTSRGSLYLYLGSAAGLGSSAGTTAGTYQRFNDPTNADYDNFGASVAGAGDVNGDGYADVLVGAYQTANGGSQRGSVFLYYGAAAGLGSSTGTSAGTVQRLNNPNNANLDEFGYSVAGAGDVNGDGYGDVLGGAPYTANGGSGRGSAYLYLGSPGPLLTSPGLSIADPNNANNDEFGFSLAGVGDVNGDGYADALIGAPTTANGGSNRGSAYLYYGAATGLGTTTGTTAGTVQRFNDPANANADYFGCSVAGAGDVNGDGYADVLIGAENTANGGTFRGSAYLYYGAATGLTTTAGTTAGTVQRLNNPNNADFDAFGYSVTGAGDVNADGYADVLIGAPITTNGGSQRGSAYLYYGAATGLGTTAGATAGTVQRLNDPNNADNDTFGISVGGAGDVNGDGCADVLVGAYFTANGGSNRGSAYLYYGAVTGLGTTAGTAPGTVQRLNDPANADGDQFGIGVAGAGDVNADGYTDVLIGAPGTANGGTQRGSIYLYYGAATGLTTTAGTTPGTVQRLNDPANADADFFGNSVAGAGDVNGDGYADVLVGAYQTANGGSYRGSTYLYLGNVAGPGTTAGTTAGTYQRLNDPANANNDRFGISVGGAGDVNGDGYTDVLVGAYGTANGGSYRGSSYLYPGNQGDARPGGRLRLLNADLSAPFRAAANKPASQFGVGLSSRSVLGRTRARLVWEVVAQGQSFSQGADGTVATSVQASGRGPWVNLGATGTELTAVAGKAGRLNRVRARLEYASASLAAASPAAGTGGVGGSPRYGPWQYVTAQQLSQLTATPLPVQLVAFAATATGSSAVQLTWATASEVGSATFEVQRSPDGRAWITLGQVAAGSSATRHSYAYLDGAAPTGTSYYRLAQADQDGSTYSPVRTVTLGGQGLALWPNPASGGAATLSGAVPGQVVRVLDALGRVAATVTADADGMACLVGLAPGLYLVLAGAATLRLAVE